MGNFVTVACKLPHGLRLRIQVEREQTVPMMGGGMLTQKQWFFTDHEVVLKGFAHEFGKAPDARLADGYALTFGVDKDFFETWLEQNKDTAIVRERLVFAHGELASVEAQALENADVRSGLEALDPEKLPLKGVETADQQSADTEPGKAAARRRRS